VDNPNIQKKPLYFSNREAFNKIGGAGDKEAVA